MSGADSTVWRLPFTVSFTDLAICPLPSATTATCVARGASGGGRRKSSLRLQPIGARAGIRGSLHDEDAFIPAAAAWLGKVQR